MQHETISKILLSYRSYKGKQSIKIKAFGPNLWISHDWESVGHRNLRKKGRGLDQNKPVSGVTIIYLMQRDTSPLHEVDQSVGCWLWNVDPLLQ